MRKWIFAILVSLSVFCGTFALANPGNEPQERIKIQLVVEPNSPLMARWCFVIDNSHSMRDIFPRVNAAFLEAIAYKTDELEYALVAFNNQGMDRFRDWQWASESGFAEAYRWLSDDKHNGVMSYGASAIRTAIQQERDELTVLLITDGGFTEVSRAGGNWDVIRRVFREAQQWRAERGLHPAQIVSLGVSNPHYTAGNKPSDEECQNFLREIGTTYGGGYWLVSGAF